MKKQPRQWDPELEVILREVATDPRSRLWRNTKRDPLRALEQIDCRVEPTDVSLTTAERHLLTVYRCELAFMLREACQLKLHSNGDRKFSRRMSFDEEPRALDAEDWYERAKFELGSTAWIAGQMSGREELLDVVMGNGYANVPVLRLAAAALRLEPADNTRIFAGMDLLQRNEPQTALRVFRSVLKGAPSPAHAGAAWDNVGAAFFMLEKYKLAKEAYEAASMCGDLRLVSLAGSFVSSMQMGDARAARRAADRIDECVPRDHPEIEWFVESNLERRQAGEWAPTKECSQAVGSIRDDLRPVARRVSDVLV